MQPILDRFISYITVDTQSDPNNSAFPSTEKQWVLARMLEQELIAIGLNNVKLDENCYLTATLPSNVTHQVPVIGFVAHIDTSPDFSGKNVNPQIHYNYNGENIVLNAEKNIILDATYFDDIQQYKGQTIITTDGTTLLGADDKAGITEIVSAMEYLTQHPEIKHGEIRICFTPDEEVGKGAHKFDVAAFGAEWAYTMDGSQIGELEYENFNAASAVVTVQGKNLHPGYAKHKMVNAILCAQEFISELPANEVPEKTTGYEGFYHLHDINGDVEQTTLEYIVRDHDLEKFEARKEYMKSLTASLNQKMGEEIFSIKIKDQYFNMKEKIAPVMHIVDIAAEAMEKENIEPIFKAIRGGTDGSQLSFMGLPCPNIFAGGHNFHGKYEYVPLESIERATKVIINIAEITANKYQ